MLPTLRPGTIVITQAVWQKYIIGDVIIAQYDGRDIIKRIADMRASRHLTEIYLLGDNPDESSDSRDYGWLPISVALGKVIWPRQMRSRPATDR